MQMLCTSYTTSFTLEQQKELKDYGIYGHIFEIIEQSLIEVIEARLKEAQDTGKLAKMQKQFQAKVLKRIENPARVMGLKRAIENRSYSYDPSITRMQDLIDHKGEVIVKAGVRVNSLDYYAWGEPLILIDGEDQEQVKWANDQIGQIVLVNGSPLKMAKELAREVYFDQGGYLSTKFKVRALPSIIKQVGKLLEIREVKI
jgi:conjugal transfer pilus assembly protein TraW